MTRELTKLHEEVLRGSAAEIATILEARPAIKGEITLLVGPPGAGAEAFTEDDLSRAVADALVSMPASKAAAEVSRRFGVPKKDIYARILALKSDD